MLQCIAMFQCCRGVTCSNGVWWIIQANKPHLLHVTWVVGALGVLWWDWDGQRSTSPTSTRPRGTTRQAGWTLRPRQSRVTHWAGTQARGRHRLIDTFVKKTQTIIASSEDASVNLDHLSQFYLLHCLTREQHRPVSWKAPVQLVAWTLQKKIISFSKRHLSSDIPLNFATGLPERQTELKKDEDFEFTLSGNIRLPLCKCLITFANMIKSLSTNEITISS